MLVIITTTKIQVTIKTPFLSVHERFISSVGHYPEYPNNPDFLRISINHTLAREQGKERLLPLVCRHHLPAFKKRR
jgi:hypothetical protein